MIKISNVDFLDAVSGPSKNSSKILSGEYEDRLWICSKKGVNNNWFGETCSPNSQIEDPKLNNYFCISKLRSINGKVSRKKANFFCMMCLVLDDVGTKAKRPDLEPSWIIETSPQNEQWGYILEKPITNESQASQLVNALVAKGYSDSGATGPSTRYMRLPVGSNDKPEHLEKNNGQPYPHNLKVWNSALRYTEEELRKSLELDIIANDEQKQIEQKNLDEDSDKELISDIITGKSYHGSIRNLAARYSGRGFKEKDIIRTIQGFMSVSSIKDKRWKERYDDIPRLANTAIEKFYPDIDSIDKFKPVSASDFVKAKPISWAIKHILPAGGLAMIYGPSGSGKSFFALDITASISRGVPWCGKKVKQGKITYIAAERVSGFRSRINAYCEYHNIKTDDFLLRIIAETPDLTKDNDKALIASIIDDGGADVVVIDTLAQVSAGANENSAEDMSMVLKRCQNIQRETGALVLLIHHSGKDSSKGERGWSGMRAAMDTVIKITSKNSHKTAEITKQKDGDDNFKISFDLKQVELGVDEDNETITSCIVELENSYFSSIGKPEPKGDIQKLIYETLETSNKYKEMNKEDLIKEVRKNKNRRRSSIVRSIGDMVSNSILEESQKNIKITQQHNTLKNSTCAVVTKSEDIAPHTHQSLEMCSGASDVERLYKILQ